ncbi:MAG: class I SAM-dependent methyltransferase [Acidimicrobiales bacterium]
MAVASLVESVLGADLPVGVDAYDGSRAGPRDASTTIVIRSPDALRRLVFAPGELGLGRAYVAGDLDVDGDIFELLALRDRMPDLKLGRSVVADIVRVLGVRGVQPVPPPPEEARLHGRRHSKARDAAAISHHYDVGNDFYRIVLGPSLTYSCAVWAAQDDTLEEAQARKYELICRKLGLQPGLRLLDVGCGWGSMVLHAARHHGVQAVGVTLSRPQADLARKRVAEAGLTDRVEIRLQDERDVDDGPYDAISSIGMFEHVGAQRLSEYFYHLHELVCPGGRVMNHGIGRPAGTGRARFSRRGFADRFVFPDGELLELGHVVSAMQDTGLEVRHEESLREHYARTLRSWVANLESAWDEAVRLAGTGRARVWRLYMAASAVNFEAGRATIHQVLGVRPDGGASGMPLRPDWTL